MCELLVSDIIYKWKIKLCNHAERLNATENNVARLYSMKPMVCVAVQYNP